MIPVNEPLFTEKELEYVQECVKTGWVSSAGKFIQQFEEKWAAYCGRKSGIAVSSGTAALHLACIALDLKPGDEVILPTFTIISCALAVIYAGGKPVLVDADPETWCLDINQVKDKITKKTRAIMPVHIYGHPVDMDPILELAEKYGLAIIEDAAEAHGAEYKGRKCGSFGTISCFSFYANKPITTGEGGMVLTNNKKLAEKLRSLRNLCFGKGDKRFLHTGLGYNYRLTNLQAALGLAQVERIEKIVEKKRWIAQKYTGLLKNVPHLQLPTEKPWAKNVYWMYGVVLKNKKKGWQNLKLKKSLEQKGIQTRPFFLGLHEQPSLQKKGLFQNERYPAAEELSRKGLYLPSGLTLTEREVQKVVHAFNQIVYEIREPQSAVNFLNHSKTCLL